MVGREHAEMSATLVIFIAPLQGGQRICFRGVQISSAVSKDHFFRRQVRKYVVTYSFQVRKRGHHTKNILESAMFIS